MTIKEKMKALVDGADRNTMDDLAGFMAASLSSARLPAAWRMPAEAAKRLRAFADNSGPPGVPPFLVRGPVDGFSSVTMTDREEFNATLAAAGLSCATDIAAALESDGFARFYEHCVSEEPAPAPAEVKPNPLVPDVAMAFSLAAKKFLDAIGGHADVPCYIDTPCAWEDWEEDGDPFPYGTLDVGEFVNCVQEMQMAATARTFPSLAAIETAEMVVSLQPDLPGYSLRRAFYALAENDSEIAPGMIGRYVAVGESMPSLRALMSEFPGIQLRTGSSSDDPFRGLDTSAGTYLSASIDDVASLYGPGTAAFVGYGAQMLARQGEEPLLFASDAKGFWTYVRKLLARWIQYGLGLDLNVPNFGFDIVFHQASRIGVNPPEDFCRSLYPLGTNSLTIKRSQVDRAAGSYDGRGDEFNYYEEEYEGDDHYVENKASLAKTATAAVFGFAVVNAGAGLDGAEIAPTTPLEVREGSAVSTEDDAGDDATPDRITVKDLPFEWAAISHGMNRPDTLSRLREAFSSDDWLRRVCIASREANDKFPVGATYRGPNPLAFVRQLVAVLRAAAPYKLGEIGSAEKTLRGFHPGFEDLHGAPLSVTCVYSGMTPGETPDGDANPPSDLGAFYLPQGIAHSMLLDPASQRLGFWRDRDATDTLAAEVTDWLDTMCREPQRMTKCAARRKGSSEFRYAWTVFETNHSYQKFVDTLGSLDTSPYNSRDVIREMFLDAVVLGKDHVFNRFFAEAPTAPCGKFWPHLADLLDRCSVAEGGAADLAEAFFRCPTAEDAARQRRDSIDRTLNGLIPPPLLKYILHGGEGRVLEHATLDDLRAWVKVDAAPDINGRFILFIGVRGDVASVARLLFRASGTCLGFPVLSKSMAKAVLEKALQAPNVVAVEKGASPLARRDAVYRAMFNMVDTENTSILSFDRTGGVTPLIMSPRENYPMDEPYPYYVYAGDADEVQERDGKLTVLPGFLPARAFAEAGPR